MKTLYASSVRARHLRESENDMSKTLTSEQLEMLRRLAAMPDDQIDTSDIPEITDSQWEAARQENFFRPLKRPVTIRLDADVLDWFKKHAGGKGYQTDINRALRKHVIEAEAGKAS